MHKFLTLPIGSLYKSKILFDPQTTFLFWFLFDLKLKVNHYVIEVILLDILLLVYLFKSNSLECIHLSLLVRMKMDIA